MGRNQYWARRVYDLCVYNLTGAPEGSPKVVSCGFFYGEAGNRTCDPWFTRHSAYPLHHGGFSMPKNAQLCCLWPCSLAVPVLAGWFFYAFFVVLCPGTPKGSTGSGSGFKASQETGQRLKVSSDRLGELKNAQLPGRLQ